VRKSQIKNQGLIFIISGPSGSGKTTLLEKLLARSALKKRLVRSISFTTRPKRSNEQEGRDYFFISQKQFREKQKAKKLLEWTRYLGYYYATAKDFVEKQLKKGKHLAMCLDVKGALQIRRLYPKRVVTIFIQPPSLETLQERIKKRCHRTRKEEVQKRLRLAKTELLAASSYDYCLVNVDLRQVIKELQGIISSKINSLKMKSKFKG
jgi:guanylate kinase